MSEMENLDLVIDKETGYYNRSFCREREEASDMIRKLYGAEKTLMTSSGMNSIFVIIDTVLEYQMEINKNEIEKTGRKLSFLFSNELFTDSKNRVIRLMKKKYSEYFNFVTFKYEKKNHFENIVKGYSKTLSCIFFEASSNPSSQIVDFEFLDKIVSSLSNCYVVIDNTWLTPLVFNPFKYKCVSCVVDSCSKYLSAGKCIAGHLTFRSSNHPITEKIDEKIRIMGIHVSPIHCDLVRTGVEKLPESVSKISEKTKSLLALLVGKLKSNIIEIEHPHLGTHRSRENYIKFVNIDFCFPGVIWFLVKVKDEIMKDKSSWKARLGEIVKRNNIRYATSFGKPYSLIDQWPKKEKRGIWLRLSVGYSVEKGLEENISKILDDLIH